MKKCLQSDKKITFRRVDKKGSGLQIELSFRKSVCVDWIGVQFSQLDKKGIFLGLNCTDN